MRNYIILIFLLFFCKISFSQTTLKGQVIDSKSKKSLYGVHILNLNTVVGSVSDKKGNFEITAKAKDTVIISHIGYESIKLKVTNDLLKGNELEIALNEKPEEVKEVIIKSTKLIGILEVDVKQVPKDKFTRIHLNGVPQTYEVGKPKKISSPISKIFNPVDLVYNLFGKKPKKLRKLRRLRKEDELRKMFAKKFDREVMMEYLEMNKEELSKLLSDCNYSEYYIQKASDLQLIEAILNCYEKHKAVKKGKIERSRIPNKINQ